ncbi:MAG: hypothetical protein KDA27_03205 [Candidatus Eisenbacteria bacterium]|uniref:Thiol:disulfide interchange protein n=1 Tax=Eiseniibacteriota bacterium TaxID=2212470 RepID=A0A956ND00_UNCEI|nr:hypothetical protein [Candidatus Eisenbacteria bacterium]MCB9464685.1 hypothetical protein [Candidatus Eisenbacteria bacterium]
MKILMKPVLLGAVTALLAATAAQAGYESLEAARAAAAEQQKPLLLDFYTEW